MSAERPHSLVEGSLDLIAGHQAATGAYLAAAGFENYRYCWLRDGAFIAAAMDDWQGHESASRFHHWAAATIERHGAKVDLLEAELDRARSGTGNPLEPLHDRYVLHTRFTLGGEEGGEGWGNFQLDGYGFWLSGVARHVARVGADPEPFRAAVDIACRYLLNTWDLPCYDAWEEYPTRRHMTTQAAVAQGLRQGGHLAGNEAAVKTADEIERHLVEVVGSAGVLRKFVPEPGDPAEPTGTRSRPTGPPQPAVAGHERVGPILPGDTIDGSALLVLGEFGPLEGRPHVAAATLHAIEDQLVVGGGVHRYLEDEYYGGGLWIVLAGALAEVHAESRPERAAEILDWIEAQADADGGLAEQTSGRLLKPGRLQPWIERWGTPARPLLWSHAMYLLAAAKVGRQVG